MATALVALAQLFAIATASNKGARYQTYATVLAYQKMEQLRGLTYGFDTLGLPLTDISTDTTTDPPTPNGGAGLAPSPGGTLGANVSGYVDYLDAKGKELGGGSSMPQN